MAKTIQVQVCIIRRSCDVAVRSSIPYGAMLAR